MTLISLHTMPDTDLGPAQPSFPASQKPDRSSVSKRAPAACTLCRHRKIRCDARNGQPCSICTFDNVQCVFVPKQQRRKGVKQREKRQNESVVQELRDPHIISSYSTNHSNDQPFHRHPPSSHQDEMIDSSNPELASMVPRAGLTEPTDLSPLTAAGFLNEIDWRAAAVNCVPAPVSPSPSASALHERSVLIPDRHFTALATPPYLKPIPPHLTREDVDYLRRRGALSVPNEALRDALIESYALYIHPCLPLIDLGHFCDTIRGTVDDRISFTLFQAVLFAGAAWVDIRKLRQLGYLTRKAARKAFYLKARVSQKKSICALGSH